MGRRFLMVFTVALIARSAEASICIYDQEPFCEVDNASSSLANTSLPVACSQGEGRWNTGPQMASAVQAAMIDEASSDLCSSPPGYNKPAKFRGGISRVPTGRRGPGCPTGQPVGVGPGGLRRRAINFRS
uniref:Uncharacterized protein n=1 Tax=Zea mays TaxID=4577 RepID=A0A804QRR5_MAIZE